MIFFEHYGRKSDAENPIRQAFIIILMALAAVALFPFTLLGLLLWSFGRLLSDTGRRLSFR